MVLHKTSTFSVGSSVNKNQNEDSSDETLLIPALKGLWQEGLSWKLAWATRAKACLRTTNQNEKLLVDAKANTFLLQINRKKRWGSFGFFHLTHFLESFHIRTF